MTVTELRRALAVLLASGACLTSSLGGPCKAWGATSEDEARISIDVRDVGIADAVRLLAEVGGFQVVIDSEVTCSLTMKLKQVPWEAALDVALRSCGLAREEENGIVRVAPAQKLAAELRSRRLLQEERRLNQPTTTTLHRLSYARAQELAPLIQKFLSPRGQVVIDARTNTLMITDVP